MAMTFKQRMNDLKSSLQYSEDFSGTVQKFFAATEDSEFGLSKAKDSELLETMLEKVLEQIFREPKIFILKMMYIKKFSFYHGSFITDPFPGTIFYFESIQMGMVAVPTTSMGDISYLRFTADIVKPGGFTGTKSTQTH